MFDLVIRNGIIIDGTGTKGYVSDLGIKDNKIVQIALDLQADAKETIDARGHIISPGFIDIHGNSDWTLFINNKGESKIRQGVTTEVQGNCGFSAGPVIAARKNDLMSYLSNTVLLDEKTKENWNWESQADFMKCAIEKRGIPFNIAPLVGHGTLKVSVMGFEKREPTREELDEMLRLLRQELESGIFGLSSGLEYAPGLYTSKAELIELCKVVSEFDGVYSTHMRNEGRDVLESISESISVARQSQVSLLITHLKAAYRPNWGKSKEALQIIDEARNSGVLVDFDIYPYAAFGSGLIDLIPPWAKEQGAVKMAQQLKDADFRNRVVQDMKSEHSDWDNPLIGSSWKDMRIALLKSEKNQKYEGRNLAQVAEDMGVTPYEAIVNLLIEEEGGIKAIYFAMSEADVEAFMQHERAMLSSDGRAVAPYGELGRGAVHPRYYGTYPKILGHYVREKQILSLEEAIRKCTSLPAQKMQIQKRGQLKEGYYADICIFNKDTIIDTATFEDSHQYPQGIDYVIVNGEVVVENGKHTGSLPGKVLKR